jgi:hypothetical protein
LRFVACGDAAPLSFGYVRLCPYETEVEKSEDREHDEMPGLGYEREHNVLPKLHATILRLLAIRRAPAAEADCGVVF